VSFGASAIGQRSHWNDIPTDEAARSNHQRTSGNPVVGVSVSSKSGLDEGRAKVLDTLMKSTLIEPGRRPNVSDPSVPTSGIVADRKGKSLCVWQANGGYQ
jgi:hypothetical protein